MRAISNGNSYKKMWFGLAPVEAWVKDFTMAFQCVRTEESSLCEDTEMTL